MPETLLNQQSPAPNGKKMPPSRREQLRGLKEGSKQLEILKAQWPKIFDDPKNIRPLSSSVAPQIAAALGWIPAYTRGVLGVWKNRSAYCRAVLSHSVRINLDGSPSEEVINDRDRELAKAQLDRFAARSAANRERELTEETDTKGNRRVGLTTELSQEWVEVLNSETAIKVR
jgi:sRNA-binding protein